MIFRTFSALTASALIAGLFAVQLATAQTQSGQPAEPPLGHLAAGDDVTVIVFREKDLFANVYVDDRDQIALPRLGVIDVSHLTSDMLRDTVRARYAQFLRDPAVDVRALRRVTVNGSVMRPDVYLVDPSLSLRDVIARAGGVGPDGDPHKVSLVRGAVSTKYPNWSQTSQGQTQLRSGDEIDVGRRNWAALNIGAVVGIAGLVTSLIIAFRR